MSDYKLSYYTIITDVVNENSPDPKRILYSTRTGLAITIKDEILEKVKQEKFESISNDVLMNLIESEFIVPKMENEFDEVMIQNRISLDDNTTLGITMQPGANCQLGCHYCGQVHTKKAMSEDMYPQLLKRIESNLKNKNYNHLSVTWYGGEPLMAYKQIRELTNEFSELAKTKNLAYSAGMITNGLSLKINIFEELVTKYHLNFFQITIDGTKEHHDTRRITKEGASTFDIIFKNVVAITAHPLYKEKGVVINIRINIDQTNYQSVIPLLEILVEHNLQKLVKVQFAPITDWGGNDAAKNSLSKEDFAVIEIDWLMFAIKHDFHFDLLPTRILQTCMVVDHDQEVYDANGNIYPCWEFPYTPTYEGGEYLIGNISNHESSYNTKAITRDWYDDLEKGTTWCKTCQFLPACGGSCPKSWYEGTPACPTFKYNMEDRLTLQYIVDSNKFKELV